MSDGQHYQPTKPRWHRRHLVRAPFGWFLRITGSIGIFAFGATVMNVAIALVRGSGDIVPPILWMPLMLAGIVGSFLYIVGDRLLQKTGEESLYRDRREPILLLRSFQDDALPSLTLEQQREKFATENENPFDLLRKLVFIAWSRETTFEEVLKRPLSRFGPVVAARRPRQWLLPYGAARLQLGKDWKPRVSAFIRRSRIVVMILAADTDNVQWELDELARLDVLKKTLIVLPPPIAPITENALEARWNSFRTWCRDRDITTPDKLHPDDCYAYFTNQGNCEVVGGRSEFAESYAVVCLRVLAKMSFSRDNISPDFDVRRSLGKLKFAEPETPVVGPNGEDASPRQDQSLPQIKTHPDPPPKQQPFLPITVDGLCYRQRWENDDRVVILVVFQETESRTRGQRLCSHFPTEWITRNEATTDSYVPQVIRAALAEGWRPNKNGGDFTVDVLATTAECPVQIALRSR
jgi:hypothetical protein